MACMTRPMGSMVYGSPPDSRIKELENRVVELEKLVERLTKSNKPSFRDFDFIKQDEDEKRREEERNRSQISRMSALFNRNDR